MKIQNGALGHIVLNVADLKKSEDFYRSILGLKVSARNLDTRMTFLSYGKEHHDIALQALPKGSKHVSGKGMPKLHHFCVYVDSNDIIDKIHPILKTRKIPIVSGPETLVVAGNRSISFLDPDGNRVEIACNANKFQFDNRRAQRDRQNSPQHAIVRCTAYPNLPPSRGKGSDLWHSDREAKKWFLSRRVTNYHEVTNVS